MILLCPPGERRGVSPIPFNDLRSRRNRWAYTLREKARKRALK
jgi:hypothetical protein